VTESTYANAGLTGQCDRVYLCQRQFNRAVWQGFALGLNKTMNCLLTISIQRTGGVAEFH